MTPAERELVSAVVVDSPRELDEKQTVALATALRRSPEAIPKAISNARADIQQRAADYGRIHHEAVVKALESGEFEVAAKEFRQMLSEITDDVGKRVLGLTDAPGSCGRSGAHSAQVGRDSVDTDPHLDPHRDGIRRISADSVD
jgi:hypothetical protein